MDYAREKLIAYEKELDAELKLQMPKVEEGKEPTEDQVKEIQRLKKEN